MFLIFFCIIVEGWKIILHGFFEMSSPLSHKTLLDSQWIFYCRFNHRLWFINIIIRFLLLTFDWNIYFFAWLFRVSSVHMKLCIGCWIWRLYLVLMQLSGKVLTLFFFFFCAVYWTSWLQRNSIFLRDNWSILESPPQMSWRSTSL